MSNRDKWPKVRAATITVDNMRWYWRVMGHGYCIDSRVDLSDGRIKFQISDGSEMIVQPGDYIRAKRQVHGYWTTNDKGEDVWFVPDI